jgi:hypothetical protein
LTVSSVIVTDLVPLRDRGVYQGMHESRAHKADDRNNDDGLWSWDDDWRTISRVVERSSWMAMVFLGPGKSRFTLAEILNPLITSSQS